MTRTPEEEARRDEALRICGELAKFWDRFPNKNPILGADDRDRILAVANLKNHGRGGGERGPTPGDRE